MKSTSLGLIAVTSLALSACNAVVTDDTDASSSSPSVESSVESSVRETRNVSYQGKVQKAGMSIYMEGTHRLELADGRFVLLESDDLDLDRYVQKNVAILGSVRATAESDGSIMRVEQITLLQQEEAESSSSEEGSSSSSEESSSSSSSLTTAAAASKAPAVVSSVSVATITASSSSSSSSSSVLSSSSSSVVSSSSSSEQPPLDSDLAAKTAIMAKANLAEANWTQKYCSTHIGFCFPVHKNWWFKSFGTTSSSLWHVEIGTGEMTELGQGPMVVNLMSGSLGSAGKSDGAIVAQGDFVVGYKAFNERSHFEISAPKALDAAVRYITPRIQAQ